VAFAALPHVAIATKGLRQTPSGNHFRWTLADRGCTISSTAGLRLRQGVMFERWLGSYRSIRFGDVRDVRDVRDESWQTDHRLFAPAARGAWSLPRGSPTSNVSVARSGWAK